ncbi:MFS transporter [Sphingomonas changnyeongensis]|uniref:MFS transporter n=1 Tax=Sphingomonas changnyeongensis TaxID=2698679 RepID=A0A7Z2NY30_9SPHN|nr:MFS transporter [Sphingomonas changnyeongensis]QHL91539.1 MFS transporter [Sphingomonas changnyeongensis]
MQSSMGLLTRRRFLPLFVTQFLGAFNDNLFKNAMVLFAVYNVYSDPKQETWFSGLATGLFILPFFLLSATSGQLADATDKARIIRLVKLAEILIMIVGAIGLLLPSIPLMLAALLAMGVHSTFFGPIKYAILPQHLERDEVLAGTGLVEAGTYISILAGTIIAGVIPVKAAAAMVVIVAVLGYLAGRQVPPAPPTGELDHVDHNPLTASYRLVSSTMHIRKLFLAILSISFFWMIGAVLFVQFPPLVKNVLTADKAVASLFLAVFSVGVAIGSVIINRLLKGEVSARYSPPAVIVMGGFVLAFYLIARSWVPDGRDLYDVMEFIAHPGAPALLGALLGVAIAGGVFVVPLYAFLTTTVSQGETARTVAANNIVNSGAMVIGSVCALGLSFVGVSAVDQFLMTAGMCLISAALAWKLHRACD